MNSLKIMPKYIWSNIDIITNDYLPYIGYIDENLLIGTGYNTWGMTNGSIAGKILSDIVMKKNNKYIKLFNPLSAGDVSILTVVPTSASAFAAKKASKADCATANSS